MRDVNKEQDAFLHKDFGLSKAFPFCSGFNCLPVNLHRRSVPKMKQTSG